MAALKTASINILRLSLVQEGCNFEGTPPQWDLGCHPDIKEIMCIYILYTIIYIRWTCAINVLYICYIRVTYVLCLCYVGYVCVSVVHVLHVDMIYVYVICVCTYIHPSGHLT